MADELDEVVDASDEEDTDDEDIDAEGEPLQPEQGGSSSEAPEGEAPDAA